MIGMVNALAQSDSNAPAGFTVVPPEESGTGSYVLTFKKAAADGETLHNWAEVEEGGSLEFLRSATSISIITEGDCELSTADVIHIMGGNSIDTDFPLLTTLDMGDAKLASDDDLVNMKYAKTNYGGNGLTRLTSFVFPKTTTGFHQDMFSENTTIQEIIMLEGSLSTIPTNAFNGCTSLSNISIPNGVTSIGKNAFKNCPFQSISLPNTLVTIGENAFDNCRELRSITIPASVTEIGASAFQHNVRLTDVYVIGENVTIGNQAFDNTLTHDEFKYDGSLDGDPNTVTIVDWKSTTGDNVGQIPLRLHIPNTQTALERYMNPNLRFLNAMNDPRMVKQALEALNETSSDEAVQQVIETIPTYFTERWFDNINGHEGASLIQDVLNQLKSLCNANQIYSENDVMPSNWETMEGWRYFHKGDGKFDFGSGQSSSPYAGWWNFMFVAGDIDEKTWPDTRLVDSRWYSAVFPFDMSYNQVESTYGANTDVREFTNVCEHTVDGKLTRTVRFNTKPAIPLATLGGSSEDKNKAGYIVKGRPYMIHPGTRVEIITVGDKKVGRTIAGVNVEEAQAIVDANSDEDLETVKRPLVHDVTDNNSNGADYYFKGTFQKQDMLPNTFYLGYDPKNPTRWPLAFYVSTTGGTNKWSAFTSVVRKTDNSAIENAKSMGIDFTLIIPEEEIFGITTGIESVSDQKSVNNGVVYNLNGQIIGNQSTSNLSKGIYIVNGKKIVVR